jgi:hypothetical protein
MPSIPGSLATQSSAALPVRPRGRAGRGAVVFGSGVLLLLLSSAIPARAQYTANIQGVVEDPSAAGIANARVDLVNLATQVSATTTSDASGNYRFLGLAPGAYKMTAEAQGFKRVEKTITLQTNQTLNLPITLEVGALSETVTVSGTTPLVNAAETRNQLTLETGSLSDLPLPGRNYISLVTQAPGVSGLGTMGGGQPGGAGTPGSGVDNYSTETAVDASANGQGTVANKFIIDGLNVTSGIRQGVLNLTPSPDTIQETTVQVNTFTSEYGGGSSIQMISTTKSGTDRFHGLFSDYYNNDSMYSKTAFMGPTDEYNPSRQHPLGCARRADHSEAPAVLLLRRRPAAIVGVDGEPDNPLSRPAVCDVGSREPPEYVRHADPEYVCPHRSDGHGGHPAGEQHLSDVMRHGRDQQSPLLAPDD